MNSVQKHYLLKLDLLPLYSPILPKDTKIKWFWLIIPGSPPLYKGNGGWSFIYFLKRYGRRGKHFSPKVEKLFWESNLWLLFSFAFVIQNILQFKKQEQQVSIYNLIFKKEFQLKLKFTNICIPLRTLLAYFRGRHQYNITFRHWYSITFCGGGWKGDQILKYRFSFKEEDSTRISLFFFSRICNTFLSKVQHCNYEFVFKSFSKQLNFPVGWNLNFNRSVNGSYHETNEISYVDERHQRIWHLFFIFHPTCSKFVAFKPYSHSILSNSL